MLDYRLHAFREDNLYVQVKNDIDIYSDYDDQTLYLKQTTTKLTAKQMKYYKNLEIKYVAFVDSKIFDLELKKKKKNIFIIMM
jgi:hypothetical protein